MGVKMKIPTAKRKVPWRKQERKLHEEGIRKQPGSGNGSEKGDNKGEEFLIQAKTTGKKQFIFKLDDWKKAASDAHREDRLPVMQVQLCNQDRFAIIQWEDFEEILENAGMEL